jgi:hypothetical protein
MGMWWGIEGAEVVEGGWDRKERLRADRCAKRTVCTDPCGPMENPSVRIL